MGIGGLEFGSGVTRSPGLGRSSHEKTPKLFPVCEGLISPANPFALESNYVGFVEILLYLKTHLLNYQKPLLYYFIFFLHCTL